MTIKNELMVFSKKEIFIILALLVLVALFSFTLGLQMGKDLGRNEVRDETSAEAPLHADEQEVEPTEELSVTNLSEPSTYEQEEKAKAMAHKAENMADANLNHEIDKEHVGVHKKLPMKLPKEKMSAATDSRYTLQVGSHRTVAEAAEQVRRLKRKDLDAFYLEAKLGDRGTWYRVGIGVFSSKLEAEKAGDVWKKSKKYFPAFLVQKVTQ